MEKSELKKRVDEIERALSKALAFAFKENNEYSRTYEWLSSAYRMVDSLKIIIDKEK